jgi:hypothetical protein
MNSGLTSTGYIDNYDQLDCSVKKKFDYAYESLVDFCETSSEISDSFFDKTSDDEYFFCHLLHQGPTRLDGSTVIGEATVVKERPEIGGRESAFLEYSCDFRGKVTIIDFVAR